jgi:hypothetical protein
MIENIGTANRRAERTSEIRHVAMHHESTPDMMEYHQGAERHNDYDDGHDDVEYHDVNFPYVWLVIHDEQPVLHDVVPGRGSTLD